MEDAATCDGAAELCGLGAAPAGSRARAGAGEGPPPSGPARRAGRSCLPGSAPGAEASRPRALGDDGRAGAAGLHPEEHQGLGFARAAGAHRRWLDSAHLHRLPRRPRASPPGLPVLLCAAHRGHAARPQRPHRAGGGGSRHRAGQVAARGHHRGGDRHPLPHRQWPAVGFGAGAHPAHDLALRRSPTGGG